MSLNALNNIIDEYVMIEDICSNNGICYDTKMEEEDIVKEIIESDFWKNRTGENLRDMLYYILKWQIVAEEDLNMAESEEFCFIEAYFKAYTFEMAYDIDPIWIPKENLSLKSLNYWFQAIKKI